MIDIVIKNVQIYAGDGKQPIEADIAIDNGKIVSIGHMDCECQQVIDGTGQAACPGFIDMHSHSDLRVMHQPTPEEKLRQGITTELYGQDGLGVAPMRRKDAGTMATLVSGLNGYIDDNDWCWDSFAGYLEKLETYSLPVNAAVLASHGPIRMQVLGMSDRQPDARETHALSDILEQALDEGAFGFSTGLIYPPCSFAGTEELVAYNKVAARHNAPFVVHQRDEGYRIRQSFTELLEITRQTGVHLHVSHLQANGRINWHLMDEVLSMADRHINEGGRISWDRYPYIAGCTVLSAVLPQWTFADGTEALIKNLTEPDYRQKIHDEFEKDLEHWNNRSITIGWHNIFVTSVQTEGNKWMEGKHIAELSDITRKHPVDVLCDVLAEEKLAVTMVIFYGSEDVLEKVLTHPAATIGTDGVYASKPHPRLFGCYPRFINEFVNKRKLLTMSEAIRKMTSYPASLLGIKDRGLLKEGYWADVVMMTPEKVRDKATYEDPSQFSDGINTVIVNGKISVLNGSFTGKLGGKVLRKQ